MSVCCLKSQNALRGRWEEAEGEGGAWKAGSPTFSWGPAPYHPSLDVQGGFWALMGGGGMEAITGRLWPHVPLAGKVAFELQAELWSRLQVKCPGRS